MKKNNTLKFKFYIMIIFIAGFHLGCDLDPLAPNVEETAPVMKSTDAPINTVIKARFNMPMAADSFESKITVTDESGNAVQGAIAMQSDRTVTFTPLTDLDMNVFYTVDISGDVASAEGNIMVNNFTWYFRTGTERDTSPPEITATSPVEEGTVPYQGAIIQVTFNEELDWDTINNSTLQVLNDAGDIISSDKTVYYDARLKLISIFPLNLELGKTYTARVIGDIADNIGNTNAFNYQWNFTARFFYLSGKISENGIGLGGIDMTIYNVDNPDVKISTTTRPDGSYILSIFEGNFRVVPHGYLHTYYPLYREVAISNKDVTGINFNARRETGKLCIIYTPEGEVQSYNKELYRNEGSETLTINYNSPGGDGAWFTGDDQFINSLYGSDLGYSKAITEGIVYYNYIIDAPGNDNLWFTDDDKTYKASKNIVGNSPMVFVEMWNYSDSGDDGIWCTADDIIESYSWTDYDIEGMAHLTFDSYDNYDGIWGNGNDVISSAMLYEYDEYRNLYRLISFYSAGDGDWSTTDNNLSYIYSTRTHDNDTWRTEFWSPGNDQLVDTSDDVIILYSCEYDNRENTYASDGTLAYYKIIEEF